MKKILYIFAILVFIINTSCSSYKFEFIPLGENTSEKMSKILSKHLKEDELYLSFTKTYDNFKVKIYENNEVEYDGLMTTGAKNVKGLADAFKINKNSTVTVYLDGFKKPLKITPHQMRDYKFIYISKYKKQIVIEFNNNPKALVDPVLWKPTLKDSIK